MYEILGWMIPQAGIKISRRNINNLRYADDTTLKAKCEGELKSLLVKVKKESEKAGLKLSIQNIKITASSPITSWQIQGRKVETVTDFIFLGSKITADGEYSHESKTHAPWKEAMINLGSALKSRHHFADKDSDSQCYGFPGVMYECKSWTLEKAEC